jgi:ribosomal protein S18 acetylase RimI-like enzyme
MVAEREGKPHYRDAREADIAELFRVEIGSFRTYYRSHRFTEKQFRYYLRNPWAVTWVALLGGRVVGYVLGILQKGRSRRRARLHSLAVLPRARGKGIGRTLLHKFLRQTAQGGVRTVVLEVAVANRAARRLFEQTGFETKTVLPDYYAKGADALRMEWTLGGIKHGTRRAS